MSINIYDPILKKLTPVAGNNEATVASLDALSNVNISSPTEGQIIKFDEINNIWVNVNDDNAPMELGELSNVNLLSVSNGQIIKYDATAEEWINADPQIIENIEDIPNVELTNLADGEFLVYDSLSEKWINTSLSGGYGIKISDGVISSKCFVGTTAEWGALSPIEQNEYTFVNLTDDYDEAREIDIAYVKELPLEGSIQDKFYGLLSYVKKSKVVADGFLDDDQNFIKTTTEDGYIYTSDVVDVSVNDIDYVELTSLEYDGTKFILNGETDMAIGDIFYWKEVSDAVFYGGDSATQTFHTIEKTLVVDSVPTEESNNPVASDGVYTALQTKADTSSLSLVATSGESGDVSYSHSTSGLVADNVQEAIDELADEKIDATDVSSVGKASYVQINSINNQDVLQYDLSANKWKNSTALKDLAKSTSMLGAKNLLPYPFDYSTKTTSGINAVVNSNESVTISGTNTSTAVKDAFHWCGFLSDGSWIKNYIGKALTISAEGLVNSSVGYLPIIIQDSSNTQLYRSNLNISSDSVTFTVPSDANKIIVSFYVNGSQSIDTTIKTMIRLASITDDTYEPYAKTNQQLTEDSVDWESNSVLGAKNFLTTKGTATTQGVEFAVDSNGVFTVTRKSAGSGHAYYNNGRFTLKPGTYIFSNGYNSLPSGIQATYLYNHTDGVYFTNCNNGPKTFTITEKKELAFNIEVQSSQSPNGVKIYPMIRLASDNDATYQPYAKTNRELTGLLTIKETTVSDNSGAYGVIGGGFTSNTDKKIPLTVRWTSSEKPALTHFAWNNTYNSWYIVCENWDGTRFTNKDLTGTLRYLDLM